MAHVYQKYEDGKVIDCPIDDKDGTATGHYVLNAPKWLDENPEERKRLGWIKHITHNQEELLGFNHQTHMVVKSIKRIDEYTVEDELHVLEKSEEQLAFEEMLAATYGSDSAFIFY